MANHKSEKPQASFPGKDQSQIQVYNKLKKSSDVFKPCKSDTAD